MSSLTSCLKSAGNALSTESKRAVLTAAQQYRRDGMSAAEAAARAVDDQIAKTRQMLRDAEKEYNDARSVPATVSRDDSQQRDRQGAAGQRAPAVSSLPAGGSAEGDGVAGRGPAQAVPPEVLADLAVIDRARAALDPENPTRLVVVPPEDVHASIAMALGKAIRAPIYFIRNSLGESTFGGATFNGRVYISADGPSPSIAVAVHEITHNLPTDIKKRMVDAIMETVSPIQEADFFRVLPQYKRLPVAKQREEIACRIIENDALNPGFWLALQRKVGMTEFGKIVTSILNSLDRMISGFYKHDSSRFTTDIKRVREVVSVAYAEALARQNGKPDPDSPASLAAERAQASRYAAKTGFMPYTPGVAPGIPLVGAEMATKPLFSIKEIKLTGKKKTVVDQATQLPLNKDGTVTLYYPTTKDKARQIVANKVLPAVEGTNRVYVTNESSAYNLLGPGGVGQATDGSGIKIMIDPALLQVHNVFPNGRRDFFIPTDSGGYGQRKNIQLWSLLAPNTEAIDATATNVRLREDAAAAVAEWTSMDAKQKRAALKQATETLAREHNVTTLLGENGKLQKTRAGGYGLTFDDKSVASMGLGMASAQKINEGNLNTCPNRPSCEDLCLGDSAGQNLLYGGASDLAVGLRRGTDFRAGPRLSQFLKTQAFVVNTRAFTIKLQAEIDSFKRWAESETGTETIENDDGTKVEVPKQVYQPTIRLNVTSDIDPQVWKPLMESMPDVVFYDYTKLNGDPVADNHHLTYSSTGGSQSVGGVRVYNKFSNWNQRIKRLRNGFNVAMAFSDANTMPEYVIDEASGEKFQVWNGDNYDARFLDPKPGLPGNELGKGMVIGLTNKDRTKAKVSKFVAKAGMDRGTPAEWGEVLERYAATVDGQADRSLTAIREWLRRQSGQLTVGEFNAFAGHPTVRSVGFFVDYVPARDGNTVTMQDQDTFGDGPGGRKPLQITPMFSERQKVQKIDDEHTLRRVKAGDGFAYKIMRGKDMVGHLSGFERGDQFLLYQTELSDEASKGTGLYRKAVQVVANEFPGGLYAENFGSSTALKKSLAKMSTFSREGDNMVIAPSRPMFSERAARQVDPAKDAARKALADLVSMASYFGINIEQPSKTMPLESALMDVSQSLGMNEQVRALSEDKKQRLRELYDKAEDAAMAVRRVNERVSHIAKGYDGSTFQKTHGDPFKKAQKAIDARHKDGELNDKQWAAESNKAAERFLDDVAIRFGDKEVAERMFKAIRGGLSRKNPALFANLRYFLDDTIDMSIKAGPGIQNFSGMLRMFARAYDLNFDAEFLDRFSPEAQEAAKNMLKAFSSAIGYKIQQPRQGLALLGDSTQPKTYTPLLKRIAASTETTP